MASSRKRGQYVTQVTFPVATLLLVTPMYNGPMIVVDQIDPRGLIKDDEIGVYLWWEGVFPFDLSSFPNVPYHNKVMTSDLFSPAVAVP
eukprot:7216748-Prymnesium_polylepis.1